MRYVLNSVWTSLTIGNIWAHLAKIFALIVAFFAPISPMFHLMLFFIGIDLVTGIIKSIKKKDKIVSNKLSRTLTKIFIYLSTAALAYAFQKVVLLGSFPYLVNLIVGMVLITEFKSITENADEILNTNIFNNIYEVLKNTFEKMKDFFTTKKETTEK